MRKITETAPLLVILCDCICIFLFKYFSPFDLQEKQKKGLFSASTVGKLVPIDDKKLAQWIVNKMREAMQQGK